MIPAESKRWYYVYEVTNTINGWTYIGIHSTCDLDDGYMGSCKKLNADIRKFGKDKFKKRILVFVENGEEALRLERGLVDEEFVKRSDTYNMHIGGGSEIDYAELSKAGVIARKKKYPNGPTAETKRKISEANTGEKHPLYGKHHSEEAKRKISESGKGKQAGEKHPLYGKHPSEETRRKMSEANTGEKNPLYGKHPSEETRRKMSETQKARQSPRRNSNA